MEDFLLAYAASQPIAVEHQGQRRLAAAIVATDRAIAFAEFGWDDPLCSFHPFHVIEGKFDPSGTGPWLVADVARLWPIKDRCRAREWQRLASTYGDQFRAFRIAGEQRLRTLFSDQLAHL